MLSKVRDFANVNQYIMHYLNHTVTMVAYINHLYIPQKKALLSILTSVILTPLLCFITLKLSKLQINYLQFLLIGLHFHQYLTVIKKRLPLKEILKSVMSPSNIWKKWFLYGYKNLEWYSERNERRDVMMSRYFH